MDNKQRLEYALQTKRLYDLFVIKDNIAFTYLNKHYNKANKRLDIIQDKILNGTVRNQLEGNVDVLSVKESVNNIVGTALRDYSKTILKTDNKFYRHAVEKNIETYSNILNNRIERQTISLEARIEDELRKSKYKGLSENEVREEITNKFKEDYRKGTKNVIRDALHTNESNLSFINAIENGYKYKIWNNGRSRSRVRPWHRAKHIMPVEIDDFFDIYGSFHAQLMYPGDLNGGAENVANCRCWLSYTNNPPRGFKKRTSSIISMHPSLGSRNIKSKIDNKIKVTTNHLDRLKSSISYNLKKVKNKVKSEVSNIKNKLVGRKSFKDISNNNNPIKYGSLKRKNIPKELPNVLQEGLKVFDSKIKDAKYEYGLIINLTKNTIGEIVTDKRVNAVSIKSNLKIDKNDSLGVIHNHIGHTPFNHEDFKAIFSNHNIDPKYLIVHTPKVIFIAKLSPKAIKK